MLNILSNLIHKTQDSTGHSSTQQGTEKESSRDIRETVDSTDDLKHEWHFQSGEGDQGATGSLLSLRGCKLRATPSSPSQPMSNSASQQKPQASSDVNNSGHSPGSVPLLQGMNIADLRSISKLMSGPQEDGKNKSAFKILIDISCKGHVPEEENDHAHQPPLSVDILMPLYNRSVHKTQKLTDFEHSLPIFFAGAVEKPQILCGSTYPRLCIDMPDASPSIITRAFTSATTQPQHSASSSAEHVEEGSAVIISGGDEQIQPEDDPSNLYLTKGLRNQKTELLHMRMPSMPHEPPQVQSESGIFKSGRKGAAYYSVEGIAKMTCLQVEGNEVIRENQDGQGVQGRMIEVWVSIGELSEAQEGEPISSPLSNCDSKTVVPSGSVTAAALTNNTGERNDSKGKKHRKGHERKECPSNLRCELSRYSEAWRVLNDFAVDKIMLMSWILLVMKMRLRCLQK
ncbi:hypothetical protein CEUSTIGMA_g11519.t1 [Chlamydomonas eustigma]|uniref:Uncharacterized protein n=1 Tax=Chlamydomonas eustigma TaxID=1157962 RepID=A0A250XM31_9CHLO|nr:hypothetical protein CEUSTIGMA_g11519.t1 [Chlamydomonas eustigma]|eukprot:GAX84096.1 hypothetical protein CEUSTIGMA_g11519.t1 [Chlamydomonas eustigma]